MIKYIFKAKRIIQDKKGHFITIKHLVAPENILVLYTFSNIALKYIRQKLTGANSQIYNHREDFNKCYQEKCKIQQADEKLTKDVQNVTNIVNKLCLIDK